MVPKQPADVLTASPESGARLSPSAGDTQSIANISKIRKLLLLVAFSISQFVESLNNSSLFPALPAITGGLGFTTSEAVWLISAYQLTFASFLLLSGRLSDLYNPKGLFVGGLTTFGLLSLGMGFVRSKIGLIVLRALSGIAASVTIPSALNLIVHLFPNPHHQARALGFFGSMATLGNVLGVVIGAIIVQYGSWPWIFWLNVILAIPIATICTYFIPSKRHERDDQVPSALRAKSLDIIGVFTITAAFILFIFALTTGSTDGWGNAKVLVPLIISVLMLVGFFFYETKIPEDRAALPPRLWFYPNFGALFGLALLPFMWWTTPFFFFPPLWQEVYRWSPITVGLRFLPIGIFATIVMNMSGWLQSRFRLKRILLGGGLLLIPPTILLAFADRPGRYWGFVFPSLILGTVGCTVLYSNANIGMFRTTPSTLAGTVGAIFNSALQLGSAVGLACITSIQTTVEKSHGGFENYSGRAAAFWFILGCVVVLVISMAIFLKEYPGDGGEASGLELSQTTEDGKVKERKATFGSSTSPDPG